MSQHEFRICYSMQATTCTLKPPNHDSKAKRPGLFQNHSSNLPTPPTTRIVSLSGNCSYFSLTMEQTFDRQLGLNIIFLHSDLWKIFIIFKRNLFLHCYQTNYSYCKADVKQLINRILLQVPHVRVISWVARDICSLRRIPRNATERLAESWSTRNWLDGWNGKPSDRCSKLCTSWEKIIKIGLAEYNNWHTFVYVLTDWNPSLRPVLHNNRGNGWCWCGRGHSNWRHPNVAW